MGRGAQGVRSIDVAEDDRVVALDIVDPTCLVLAITENGYGKRSPLDDYRVQSRSGKGMRAMNIGPKTGKLVAQMLVHDDEDLMLITDDGTIIRLPVSDISQFGRSAQGVRLMRVAGNSHVVAGTKVEREEETEDEELEELQSDEQNAFPDPVSPEDSELVKELLARAEEDASDSTEDEDL